MQGWLIYTSAFFYVFLGESMDINLEELAKSLKHFQKLCLSRT